MAALMRNKDVADSINDADLATLTLNTLPVPLLLLHISIFSNVKTFWKIARNVVNKFSTNAHPLEEISEVEV